MPCLLGYSVDELRSAPLSTIYPREMDRVRAFARTVSERGQGSINGLNCVGKSGETIITDVLAYPFNHGGRSCMIGWSTLSCRSSSPVA